MIDRTEQNVPPNNQQQRPRGLRLLTEALVFLAVAVTVFRWSALEGYMISTGSMATSLLGYHRLVTCPDCHFEFAVGNPGPARFAGDPPQAAVFAQQRSGEGDGDTGRCPNCDLSGVDLAGLPVTEGDQLLVHKNAFLWRRLLRGEGPRRWEVAAFRNPDDPTLTYVKRVVGLPGETIELNGGDVFADGRLQRKPFASQLGTRILIHTTDHGPERAAQPDWKPRWLIQGPDSTWTRNEQAFVAERTAATAGGTAHEFRWLRYQHWIRRGGTHTTVADLEHWPDTVPLPDPYLSPIEFDAAARQVSCFGALPQSVLDEWLSLTTDAEFHSAVHRLYLQSHVVPIADRMSYNVNLSRDAPALVTDFMLELTLKRQGGDGVFAVELTDGVDVFTGEFNFASGEVRLSVAGEAQPRASSAMPAELREQAVTIQMSTFDRQIILAVNGVPLLGPVELSPPAAPSRGISSPARIGARQLDARIDHIRLYRDVHYSSGAGERLFQLAEDEYFVMGDNSSVSVDSRHWQSPGVARDLLIGKPLLVHLPSRSRRLNRADGRRYIRVPDLPRIRYIR